MVIDAEEECWHDSIVVLFLLDFGVLLFQAFVAFPILPAIATIPTAGGIGGRHGRRGRWVGRLQQTAALIVGWCGCSLFSLLSPPLHSSYTLLLMLLPPRLLPSSLHVLLNDSTKGRRVHLHHSYLEGHLGGIVLRPFGGEKEGFGAPVQAAGTVLQDDARGQGASAALFLASWRMHRRRRSTGSIRGRPIIGDRGPLRR